MQNAKFKSIHTEIRASLRRLLRESLAKFFILDSSFFIRSVPRIGIRDEVEFDVPDRIDEPIQTLVGIAKEGYAGNDQLPLAVPNRAANQSFIGVLRRRQGPVGAIDTGIESVGGRNGPERLVLAHIEERLGERIVGGVEWRRGKTWSQ